MPLTPLPSSLNQEAVLLLVKACTGDITVETAHAGWDVAGFALSQFDTNHKPIMKAHAPVLFSRDECKAYLESLVDSDGKMKAEKIDWGKLLQIVMTILSLFAEPKPA